MILSSADSRCFPQSKTNSWSCYTFNRESLDWSTARSRCKTIGAHLVIFETIEEFNEIVEVLKSHSGIPFFMNLDSNANIGGSVTEWIKSFGFLLGSVLLSMFAEGVKISLGTLFWLS